MLRKLRFFIFLAAALLIQTGVAPFLLPGTFQPHLTLAALVALLFLSPPSVVLLAAVVGGMILDLFTPFLYGTEAASLFLTMSLVELIVIFFVPKESTALLLGIAGGAAYLLHQLLLYVVARLLPGLAGGVVFEFGRFFNAGTLVGFLLTLAAVYPLAAGAKILRINYEKKSF